MFDRNPASGKDLNTYDLPYFIGLNRGIESCLIEGEALRLGFDSLRVTPDVVYLFHRSAGAALAFHTTRSNATSYGGVMSCRQKPHTRLLLARSGLPIPPGAVFSKQTLSAASEYARSLGWPVVVKPVTGSGGRQVTAGIADADGFASALASISDDQSFLVEKHVPGSDYRFQVLDGRVVAAHLRRPANVVGDGISTVRQLIETKNGYRKTNPHLAHRLIKTDAVTESHLKAAGLDLADIPAPGRILYVRSVCNLSQGGDNIDVTEETHPSLKELAVAALSAIPGIQHAGVDMLLSNHQHDARSQEVNIIEINACPGMSAHHFPVSGAPQDVVKQTVQYHAALQNVPIRQNGSVSVRMEVFGEFDAVRELQQIENAAKTTSLIVGEMTSSEASILCTLRGDPLQAAAITVAASQMRGGGRMTHMQVQHI